MTSEEDDLQTPSSHSLAKAASEEFPGVMTSEEDDLQTPSSHSLARAASEESPGS